MSGYVETRHIVIIIIIIITAIAYQSISRGLTAGKVQLTLPLSKEVNALQVAIICHYIPACFLTLLTEQ
jgi:hypothetical protein